MIDDGMTDMPLDILADLLWSSLHQHAVYVDVFAQRQFCALILFYSLHLLYSTTRIIRIQDIHAHP